MLDRVAAYIAKRATWICARHGSESDRVIAGMVTDALGDTFARVVTWNPLRCPLHVHLKRVIRSRLSHELERAEDFEHVEIDHAPAQLVNEALLNAGKLPATKQLSRYVKEFTERLRELAAGDPVVLKLIDLHLQDVTERRQICLVTGMKPSDYHNAFRRLKRLAEAIPKELQVAALAEVS